MAYGWMLLAMLAGLWSGLLLPRFMQTARRKQEEKQVKQVEKNQEKLLNEWLYGE